MFTWNCGCGLLRSKRFTLADLADAEQTNSIFVADLRFAEQKKYLRLSALQISSLCGKLSQACGVVCKIRHFADINILRLIYFSLFHSHMQNYIIDWGRAYKTAIRPVQVLQNRILRYMTFSKRTSSANNVFKLLKILKVSDMYHVILENFMYKYNADILPSSFVNFFSKLHCTHDHGTRQQVSGNFLHKRVRTDYGKKCCNM